LLVSGLWKWAADRLIAHARRHPHLHLANADGSPYMDRYWLVKPHWWTAGRSIRIHHLHSSDAERHLHDHPWSQHSIVLRGRYVEVMPRHNAQSASYDQLAGGVRARVREVGDIISHDATQRHRIVLAPGLSAWSLCIMGRRQRRRGFHTPAGWVPASGQLQDGVINAA
jgi:hypothetical protein